MNGPFRHALVLSGGGARTSYQVGVLKALGEIWPKPTSPFQILTGTSAGAISAVFLAAHADDFRGATEKLWDLWSRLHVADIFETKTGTLLKTGIRLVKDVASGGFFWNSTSNHLLDTSPLHALLKKSVDFSRIRKNIDAGVISGIGVTASHYHAGATVTFYESSLPFKKWLRSTHISSECTLGAEHVMASSAIPLFFPPIKIRGSYYGDGCMRQTTPLSPAIHLGASHILAIGIRYMRSRRTVEEILATDIEKTSLADIAGSLLNALFLDFLESDLERAERMNQVLSRISEEKRQELDEKLHVIPIRTCRPSRDLGNMAQELVNDFPKTLRYLLKGLGVKGKKGSDILSYLAFEPVYCRPLLDLGYHDALAQRDELLYFLSAS